MSKVHCFVLAAILMLSTFVSCRKAIDYIRDHPGACDSICRITELTFSAYDPSVPQDDPLRLGITYNTKGNPLSIRQLNPSRRYITTDVFFRYDKFDRLTDYLYSVGGGYAPDSDRVYSPFIWHKYAYPAHDIITDTVITYPTTLYTEPAPVAPEGSSIHLYKYDASGRMIAFADTYKDPHAPKPEFSRIVYDRRGNKDLSAWQKPNIVYDSTINVYRTNKVWQLIYKDYSQNNPVYKTSLPTPANTFDLPTRLPYTLNGDPIYYFDIYSYYVPYYYITYACSAPKGPVNY